MEWEVRLEPSIGAPDPTLHPKDPMTSEPMQHCHLIQSGYGPPPGACHVSFPPLCIAPEPMTATMTGDDWLYEISSDDENDHRGGSDISDADGELDHGTSPHSQLPPVPGALPFLD